MNSSDQIVKVQRDASKYVNPVEARAAKGEASHLYITGKQKQTEHENAPVEYRPVPPYPKWLQKKEQNVQFRKFLDVLKQLHIKIPLVEALEQMLTYVRFLKDILTKKSKSGEYEIVALTKAFSTIFTSKISKKMKDPGSFTIPVSIGGQKIEQTLRDVRASINLMPLSIYMKLGIGEARPTTITLQLADRSITYREEKIEDVLVQVDKFIFPTDFIILDYDVDKEVPIIMGRPFLSTGRALVDVQKGELMIHVQDHEVKFSVYDSMKLPAESEECSVLKILNEALIGESNAEAMLEHSVSRDIGA
ncbi:uncharacterized protein LOC111018140 [Momordica charantia]|uniref:Uncharacterized protein LOC111018140 n=1 Tax=Momordica charantia TaxID=3673 RepID=A0A6J1D6R2_MOMCH|nr:uncharacterized protein LOC111018140 [Momordica charantia]